MQRRRVRKDSGGVTVKTRRGAVTLFGDEGAVDDHYSLAMKNYASQQIDDPFIGLYGQSGTQHTTVIQPPFDVNALMRLPNVNNTLKQCIAAMVVNIESNGYKLEYIGEEGKQESAESLNEKYRLENLLEDPNGEYSLTELRERVRVDLESMGFAFIEVGRDTEGDVSMLHHVPAATTRKTTVDPEAVAVTRKITRKGKQTELKVSTYFRRYVQQVGNKKVWFKEFGDPRAIDPKTGRENDSLAITDQATEIIYLDLYTAGHSYGLPRWINQMPSVLGSREAELTNLNFFKENAIPAMAVMVAGGALTESSAQELSNGINSVTGRESMNRVVVIEALGDEEAADEKGRVPVPTISMEPLRDARQNDGLFLEYDRSSSEKIRSSFRLPSLFLGFNTDYTRSTAETSVTVADAQVFGPERNRIDEVFNKKILLGADSDAPRFWRFRTLAPRIVSPEAIMDALSTFEQTGALTANVVIGLANQLFDMDVEMVNAPWGDYPFSVVKDQLSRGVILPGFEEMFGDGGLMRTDEVNATLGRILAALQPVAEDPDESQQEPDDGAAG